MSEDLYPIALLIDELKNEEHEVRIKAVRRLKTIAKALGPDRTRTELIPFLNDSTEDEDEILVILAEELGDFVPLVGGSEHAACLLEPLESLAGVEETVVRDKATEAICKVMSFMKDVTSTVAPMLKRLTEGDWFTSRVSACAIFAAAYQKVATPEGKKELRDLYRTLCSDDTPMVRRAAAAHLGNFASALEKDNLISEMLEIFKQLAADDQDSVRLLAIENCAALGKLLDEAENQEHVLPIVRSSVEDKSWRVRFNVAKEFFALSEAMGKKITNLELLGRLITLLQDVEAEVRAAAVKNISGYCNLVGLDTFVKEVMPTINSLAQDSAQSVRIALSGGVMDLCGKFGEEAGTQHLLPLILAFLKDECTEVRLNVLRHLKILAGWKGSLKDKIVGVISDLGNDGQWRVRESIILNMPALVDALGGDFFRQSLLDLYIAGFTDTVSDVRAAATSSSKSLIKIVGHEWMRQSVFAHIAQTFKSTKYYQERITMLYAVQNMAEVTPPSTQLFDELVDLALKGAKDKIPNVRLVAARVLESVVTVSESPNIKAAVRPSLSELANDQDEDVKFFANSALEACEP